MSVRMRHTRGHTGNRRSHHALKNLTIITDAESGSLRLPHRIDEATGMYRGKQIFSPKVKKDSVRVSGPDTEKLAEETHDHPHEHAQVEHANAEVKGSKGILGKLTGSARPKARSGFGGAA